MHMHQVGKKSDDSKDSFCEELELVLNHLLSTIRKFQEILMHKNGERGYFQNTCRF